MFLLPQALIFIYLLMNALKETLKLSECATLHAKAQGIHFLFFCKFISKVLKEKNIGNISIPYKQYSDYTFLISCNC